MNASQVFDRILFLQYLLDTTPPEESAEVFEEIEEAVEQLCSLAGVTPDQVWDAVHDRYDAYLRKRRGH